MFLCMYRCVWFYMYVCICVCMLCLHAYICEFMHAPYWCACTDVCGMHVCVTLCAQSNCLRPRRLFAPVCEGEGTCLTTWFNHRLMVSSCPSVGLRDEQGGQDAMQALSHFLALESSSCWALIRVTASFSSSSPLVL